MPCFFMGIRLFPLLFFQFVSAQNLVVNGNFESGNGVGFSTNYTLIASPNGTTGAGQYGIGSNPQPYNPASFNSMGDHTSGTGNMMIADGTNNGGNPEPFFWKINNNGEICGLTVGKTYTFSYWIKSIYKADIFGSSPAVIGIKWNNVQGANGMGILNPLPGSSPTAPPPGADWQKVTYSFIPTNACVRIEMFDWNGNLAGNDFAIDDIELNPPPQPLELKYLAVNPACPGGTDGMISAYGRGGTPPYTFSFNGGAFGPANFLTGLGAVSGQSVAIRDAASPPSTITIGGINLQHPANPLVAGTNGSACSGQPYPLNASGASTYVWTANPADASLTTPNIANPVVKPLVNTVYTVTAGYSGSRNLVFNGDFSMGNIGFVSDYGYLVSNPSGATGVYGLVAAAKTFYNAFAACTAMGVGGDLMLIADGSTLADKRVWQQELPVRPNTAYTFVYHIQSVQGPVQALVETRINDLPVTGNTVTSTQSAPNELCTWQIITYNWNSGSNTSARISLYNRNLAAAGNDFTLDNISFTENAVCEVSRQVTVNVVSLPATPTASVTVQPTCSVNTGTITITAPLGANFEYTVNGSSFQANPVFAGLSPGVYPVQVRNNATGCISAVRSLTVNGVPGAPPIATAVVSAQPTCILPTGTITVSSPLGANFEYSLDGTNYQSSPVFMGVVPGNYNVRTRNKVTLCFSNSLGLVVNGVPLPPPAPTASVTLQPSCALPTGTITVTAPAGANLEYSVDGIVYQSSPVFSGLVPKTYPVAVRNITTGCVSAASMLAVNAPPQPPAAATASVTVQPNCLVSTGTILVTAPLGANLLYSADGVNYQAGTVFLGLIAGTYNISVKDNTNGCISNPLSLTVNPVPPPPPAPVATVTFQPTCLVTKGTIEITTPAGPGLEYSADGVNWQPERVFSGLLPGTYALRVRNMSTSCISSFTTLSVNGIPPDPPAPAGAVTLQPTCLNPTGTILISSPTGDSLEYSRDQTNWQASASFSGLSPGTYSLQVRNRFTGCRSTGTEFIIQPVPGLPPTPSAVVSLQPTCAVPTGSILVNSPVGATIEYSVIPGLFQPNPLFAGLAPGTYPVRVRNTVTLCISNALSLVVNPVPAPPSAPTASVTFQPTCNSPAGTILVTAPAGTGMEYSLDGTSWQTQGTFTGLAPGNYTVRVRNSLTACTGGVTTLVVNTIPPAPDAPVLRVTAQPNCTAATGTIEVSAPVGTGLEYSINGTNWQTTTIFAGLAAATYQARVRNTATGCISMATPAVINTPPQVPAAPTAAVTVQPNCTVPTGTIAISAPTGNGLEYSLNGTTWQTGTTFSGLYPGSYPARVRNTASGCVSNTVLLVVNAPPVPPATPVASVTAQPGCTIPSGTIVITSPTGSLLDYSVDGVNFQAGLSFTGLAPGTYRVVARHNTSGCISNTLTLVVNPVPQAGAPPQVVSPLDYCQFQSGILPLTANGSNLLWYNSATGGTGSTQAPVPDVRVPGTKTFYVTQTPAAACESPRAEMLVNVSAVPVISIASPVVTIQAGQSVVLPATISGQGVSIRWTPATGLSNPFTEKPVASPQQTTTYTVVAGTSQSCSASDTIRVVVFRDVIVSNAFSPNGDGINDKWVVKYLEDYPNAQVEIFDRYGQPVYRSKNNVLPWDGTRNGQQVPSGTYYYIIKTGTGKVLNGSVTVLR